MARRRSEAAKRSLLRRVRRQRLKYVTILPSLVTLLNGVCGFVSIVLASKGQFAGASYMVFLAMIADMLDGRLARMSHSTSSFGGQLDSLCDIISFGVAPAFLMLKMVESKLMLQFSGAAGLDFLGRFVWLSAAVYVSCTTIRLARFNVENEEDETSHMSFIGLPSPAAAGALVSLVIFHQEIILPAIGTEGGSGYLLADSILIYSLPLAVFGMGILMVSRIRYPHLLNYYLKGKKPLGHLIRILLFMGVIFWNRQAALALIFCSFAGGSFFKWLYVRTVRHATTVIQPGAEPAKTEQPQC